MASQIPLQSSFIKTGSRPKANQLKAKSARINLDSPIFYKSPKAFRCFLMAAAMRTEPIAVGASQPT